MDSFAPPGLESGLGHGRVPAPANSRADYATRAWGFSRSNRCAIPFFHDGTERPINRPCDADEQALSYSGKTQGHTLKNLVLIAADCGIWFLGATDAGRWHDKRLTDHEVYALPPDSSLRHDLVFALLPEADGGLWVGTVSGLDYLAPGAERFVHYDDPATSARNVPVRALYRDRKGAIWIGTPRGLKRFDPAHGAIEAIPIGGAAVTERR